MGNVINFSKLKKARRLDTAKSKTLCGAGFHQWNIVTDSKFDVKQGRLVTVERCERCHAERTTLK